MAHPLRILRTNGDWDVILNDPAQRTALLANFDRIIGYDPGAFNTGMVNWNIPVWIYFNMHDGANGPRLLDSDGAQLYVPWPATTPPYSRTTADLSNATYRNGWIAQAVSMAQRGADGIWLDDVNMDVERSAVRSGGAAPLRDMSWWQSTVAQFMEDIAAATKAVNPNFEILHNCVWYSSRPERWASSSSITVANQWDFETTVDAWEVAGGSVARMTTGTPKVGTAYLRGTHGGTFYGQGPSTPVHASGANTTYTYSAWVRTAVGVGIYPKAGSYASVGGAWLSQDVEGPAVWGTGDWQYVTLTHTTAAGAGASYFQLALDSSTAGVTVDVDGVQRVFGSVALAYGATSGGTNQVRRQIAASDFVNIEGGFSDAGLNSGAGEIRAVTGNQWSMRSLYLYIQMVHEVGSNFIAEHWEPSIATKEMELAAFLCAGGTNGDGLGNNMENATWPNPWPGWKWDFGTQRSLVDAGPGGRITATYDTATVSFLPGTPQSAIFTITAGPTITGIAPTGGPQAGGTSVVITGTGFTGTTGAAGVKFGGVNATSYVVNSATQITAVAPAAGPGLVDVRVTNGALTSTVTTADNYTYAPLPTITSLSPSSGPIAGGTSVVITGTGFTGVSGAAAVKFGTSNAASYVVNSSTQITAFAPAAAAGTVDVSVTGTNGTVVAAGTGNDYTYTALPIVTGIAPTSAPAAGGASVVITGTGFTGATRVRFGATNASSYTVNSATQVTAVVPAGTAGTVVDVTVQTANGTSSVIGPDNDFTYSPLPTVTALTPASGPATGTTTVVAIAGTGFTGATAVRFGGTSATSYVVNSASQIAAVVPAGTAGTVDVTVTTAAGESLTAGTGNDFTYTAPPVAPTVTGLAPNVGPTVGGTSVVITGTGFTSVSGVKFGADVVAWYVVNSSTQITAVSPGSSPGTVDVTVTTAGGASATAGVGNDFTYQNPTPTTHYRRLRWAIPRFGFPFHRIAGGGVLAVEQDSAEHVTACVNMIVRCPLGFRVERPDFGWPFPEFATIPVDVAPLEAAIERLEPRAKAHAVEYAEAMDAAIRRVELDVGV